MHLNLILIQQVAVLCVATMSSALNFAVVRAQQEEQSFSATLPGKDTIPPTKSNANGTSKFKINLDNSQVSYWVSINGLKKTNEVQIYNGIK